MNVRELIERLQEIENKDAQVIVDDNCGGGYNLTGVDVLGKDVCIR